MTRIDVNPQTMQFSKSTHPKELNGLYTGMVLAFPFLVLFSPRVPLLFTHARIDEVLILLSLPSSLLHYAKFKRQDTKSYFRAFFILLAVFVFGLLYGDDGARWAQSNLNLVARPIVVILNILVVRYWIYKSRAETDTLIAVLISATLVAGLTGIIAMFNTALADVLRNNYAPDIMNRSVTDFDMSIRAMSVFAGYDQASMTYAIGIILGILLFLNTNNFIKKTFIVIAIFALFVSIVSSARIGFISLLFGAIIFFLLNTKTRFGSILYVSTLIGGMSFLLAVTLKDLFPNDETVQRFMDVFALLDFTSSLPFWERSHGVSALIATEVAPVLYPQGVDVILGFGDNGKYISDSGIITVFVKYGLVGTMTLFYTMIVIGKIGLQAGKRIQAQARDGIKYIPISTLLPGLMILFFVGSVKGGLYFTTYKIGELFAFILALCIVESERLIARKSVIQGG